jgi:hypothetical protein
MKFAEKSDEIERVVVYVDGEKRLDFMSEVSTIEVIVEENATDQTRLG